MSAPIPEDLQTWYSVACDKVHFKTDYGTIKILIERIAALEQERDQLRAEVERLSAPVTDEEASAAVAAAMKMEFGGTYQEAMEALITARRKP